jgi:hypothetical protein
MNYINYFLNQILLKPYKLRGYDGQAMLCECWMIILLKIAPPKTRWVWKSWKTKTERDGWMDGWMAGIEEDLRLLSVRGWIQRALFRRE